MVEAWKQGSDYKYHAYWKYTGNLSHPPPTPKK